MLCCANRCPLVVYLRVKGFHTCTLWRVDNLRKFDPDRVAGIVTKTLNRDFENIKIIDVNVAEEVSGDGDDILRIEVVFEGTLKGSEVAGAARRLRPALEVIDPDVYPLLSFVSKLDYERGHSKREAR